MKEKSVTGEGCLMRICRLEFGRYGHRIRGGLRPLSATHYESNIKYRDELDPRCSVKCLSVSVSISTLDWARRAL
jgi:hypothetical protein